MSKNTNKMIENAKRFQVAVHTKTDISDDEMELVEAYLTGDITIGQMNYALYNSKITKSKYPVGRILNTILKMVESKKISFN